MIQDIDEINVNLSDPGSVDISIDNDNSISVSEAAPTDIAQIMHNEEIRQENETQRIANEEQRIANEEAREDYITDLKQRVLDGEFNGEDGYSPTATVSKTDSTATITITDKNGTTTAQISDGQDGQDGVDGQDGFSPVANVSKSGDTATITITDKNGTTTSTISDGANGQDGADGYSPSASVTKSGSVATITITDKSGTTTANIYDGTGSGGIWGSITGTLSDQTDLQDALNGKQDTLVSGTNIKTIDGQSILGSGNINAPTKLYYCEEYVLQGTNEDLLEIAQKMYNDYLNNIYSAVLIAKSGVRDYDGLFKIGYRDSKYYLDHINHSRIQIGGTAGTTNAIFYKAAFELTIESGEVTAINISVGLNDELKPYLATNTNYSTPYTPLYDGSPATKKYVDDNIPDLSDYQTKITSTNKLDADLVDDSTSTNKFFDGLTILSYGSSTWNDFINAYNNNEIVYCRASSNSNPGTGSQTRLAFMAYVNNATTPTSVEFQYYRSVSSHSATQQGDQVFVYTLTSTNGGTWSVTTRETMANIDVSNGLTRSYSNNKLTISGAGKQDVIDSSHKLSADLIDDTSTTNKFFSGNYNDLTNKPTIPDELADLSDDSTHRVVTDTEKTTWNNKSDFSGSYADLTNKPTIPSISDSYGTSTANGYSQNYINGQITDINGDITDIQGDITTINNKLYDTGWVDMSSYLNTTYFSVRPGYTPMVRKIGKVCFWKGQVYCSTSVGGNQAYLFTNIPSTYAPNYEHAGCGVHFPTSNTYKMFFDGNGGIVVNDGNNWINSSLEWEGYTVSDLGSYIID